MPIMGAPFHQEIARINRERLKKWRLRINPEPPTPPPKEPKPEPSKGLVQDRNDGLWYVRMLDDNGKEHRIPTGQHSRLDALRVVDESGIQKLAILARAKVPTNDAQAIIAKGHAMSAKEIVEQWHKDLVMDYSDSLARVYPTIARRMLRRYGCLNKSLSAVTREQLYDFVNEATLKESGRNNRLAAIKSLYRSAAGYGHIIGNIADTVRVNPKLLTVAQREITPATAFTEEEYRRFVTHPKTEKFWRWAVTLGYWLGLRWVDVVTLERASLGETASILYPDKSGRRLVLPLTDPMIGSGELLQVFSEIRASVPAHYTYCFPKRNEQYKNQNHDKSFKKALKVAGIENRSFQSLRHAFKLRLSWGGKSLEEIRVLMGHRDAKTTEGYGRATATPSASPPTVAEAAPSVMPDLPLGFCG